MRPLSPNSLARSIRVFAFLLLLLPAILSGHEAGPFFRGERIVIPAHIDEKPVHFLYDTGASFTALFDSAAQRLELETQAGTESKLAGHPVSISRTNPVGLRLFGHKETLPLPVLSVPPGFGMDGVFSWRNLRASILLIDGPERKIGTPSKLPEKGWQRWELEQDNAQLFFQLRKKSVPVGRVFVDTGAVCGLRLAPPLWKEWRRQHPDRGTTLETFRYIVGEPMIHEMAWAEKIHLGDLTFHHVDVGPIPGSSGDAAMDARGKEYIAMIGIRALRHLRLIISPSTREVLTQSVNPVPNHNRLGAVLLDGKDLTSPPRVARVLPGSPAQEAGLQTGDILLSINDLDFTAANQPSGERAAARVFQLPAGTELRMRVEREGTEKDLTVTLRDLIP